MSRFPDHLLGDLEDHQIDPLLMVKTKVTDHHREQPHNVTDLHRHPHHKVIDRTMDHP